MLLNICYIVTGFQWSGEAYSTDLKLRYVESTPLEERRVDIKELQARILMYSALRGGSEMKRGVEVQKRKEEWRFSNETRSGGSVTKRGVEVR